jgi:hypothetical protein
VLLAIEDSGERLEKVRTARVPGNVTGSAELQGTGGVLGIRVLTQDEYGGLRVTGAEFPQDREGVTVIGEADIENHETPRLCLDLSHGFRGGLGLAKDDVPELLTQYLLQTQTNERMIIDDQYR